MDIIQLCDRIDRLTAEADLAMHDETANRQAVLETLLEDLADLTNRARRAGRRTTMTAVATGPGAVVIQAGGDIHGTFRD
ncbi:hypothetical protein [Catellatospora sp. NPDC049133]|uniref:hypothetical protein n=1 Tax=Catellatospora sp. NPDC049133 TaxID=3155499 RepID=UPI0033D88639